MRKRPPWPGGVRIQHRIGIKMQRSGYLHDNGLGRLPNGSTRHCGAKLRQVAFWFLPALVGAPILLNALLRHPLVRQISN